MRPERTTSARTFRGTGGGGHVRRHIDRIADSMCSSTAETIEIHQAFLGGYTPYSDRLQDLFERVHRLFLFLSRVPGAGVALFPNQGHW
jgi:hypothetical protein